MDPKANGLVKMVGDEMEPEYGHSGYMSQIMDMSHERWRKCRVNSGVGKYRVHQLLLF